MSLWTWIGTLAAIGIVAVTTVAAVDHVRKTHAFRRASNSLWYCMHRGQQCGTDPTAIENAWMAREHVYKAADAALIVVGGVAVIAVRRRRR
jgi:hypothetical protein